MMLSRFQLLLIVFIGFCQSADYVEGSGSSTTVVNLDEEERPHERPKLFNWDYKDLSSSAFEDITNSSRLPIGIVDAGSCPDGWLRFSDSCYYIEQELLGFAKAEQRCAQKSATLFVANSYDEWDAVRTHSPKAYFSWVGLVRFSQYEKVENLPRWQTEGAVNSAKINWLIKPYKPLPNGYTSLANCVAHYNGPLSLESSSYTFYYPCTFMFHSICERNATLINTSNTLLL